MLSGAVQRGLNDAFESLAKSALSSLGQALVGAYSPALAALFFGGGSNAGELQTRRVIAEIRSAHADLAERHRTEFDEILTQFRVEWHGEFATAVSLLDRWLESSRLQDRLTTLSVVEEAYYKLKTCENVLRAYLLDDAAAPADRFQRFKLIELHASAARLMLIASDHFWSYSALHSRFKDEHGTNYEELEGWRESLTSEQAAAIARAVPQLKSERAVLVRDLVAMYSTLSEQGVVEAFVDDQQSPVHWQHTTFTADPSGFDNPAVMHASGSWSDPEVLFAPFSDVLGRTPGGSGITDGYRWYYYVRIPRSPGADCLDGNVTAALSMRRALPWKEQTDPAASECDRFWIVQPSLRSSGWPNTYLTSFTNYSLWFDDPARITPLHKRLLVGDLTRAMYAPASLVLDSLYEEQFRAKRPANAWDLQLRAYEQEVALLAGTNSMDAGIRYEDMLETQRMLLDQGLTPAKLGNACWARAVKDHLRGNSIASVRDAALRCDADGDGIAASSDNCPSVANPGPQSDCNGNGVGDACDTVACDADSDGVADQDDNCPNAANGSQADCDNNGRGDACDSTVTQGELCLDRSQLARIREAVRNPACDRLSIGCNLPRRPPVIRRPL